MRSGTFCLPWHRFTPLAWAVEGGHAEVEALLREAGATLRLRDMASLGDDGAVAARLGAETEARDDALFLAAANGHLPVVERLLAAGATVDRTAPFDQQMRTPLCAAIPHAPDVVARLLQAGADPAWPTLFGKSARTYAGDDAAILALLDG